jgi:DNA invertase Pin-like site-specific DNA recombinase
MSNSPKTSIELFSFLKETIDDELVSSINPANLRYFLYARKSTYDDERQERSIPDQVRDCMDRTVVPKNLKVVGVIEEKCSAKEPDVRTEFRKMLNAIIAGKADGIISWHPDRLSRNMKEAGEIIDLVDKGVIKDLQFATSNFENTPTGKMLLGMSFVLSKQYSEHLSESVTRGNRRMTESGACLAKFKHGYFMSEDRKLFPDGDNYLIVKRAFEKRLNGETQLDIAKWLNTTPYRLRHYRKDPQSYKWDNDAVSKMLRDPTYAGVLRYGKHLVHLRDHYEFEPLISVDDFMKINKVSDLRSSKLASAIMVKNPRTTKAKLLRGMVKCGYCDKPFSSSITSKKLKDGKKHYYYYKCETETCVFKNRSVRARVVLDMIIDFFNTYHFTTQNNYEVHVSRIKETNRKKARNIASKIASLVKTIELKEQNYEKTKKIITDNPALARHYDLDRMAEELERLNTLLNRNVALRKALNASIPTYEKYLELLGTASVTIPKIHDIELMNNLIKYFFSNFIVKAEGKGKQQRYEISYKLKEPWDGFLKSNDFVSGRGDRT